MTEDIKTFGVFRHSRDGSFVVRSMWNGKAASPYLTQAPIATASSEATAQRVADGLNANPPAEGETLVDWAAR